MSSFCCGLWLLCTYKKALLFIAFMENSKCIKHFYVFWWKQKSWDSPYFGRVSKALFISPCCMSTDQLLIFCNSLIYEPTREDGCLSWINGETALLLVIREAFYSSICFLTRQDLEIFGLIVIIELFLALTIFLHWKVCYFVYGFCFEGFIPRPTSSLLLSPQRRVLMHFQLWCHLIV